MYRPRCALHIPRKGARFAYTDEADIKRETQLGREWEAYKENIVNYFLLGLQTLKPRLITTPEFMEASAKATLEATERKVIVIQRLMKWTVEGEVFDYVFKKAGYIPNQACLRLNWGQHEASEFQISDMLAVYEKGAISIEELGSMLVKEGWELTLDMDESAIS